MSFQENRSIASLIGTVLISVFYAVFILQRAQEGDSLTNSPHFWASALLLYIPVSVMLKIFVVIVFVIINTITNQEKDPELTDERDKLVNLKSTVNFYHVFMVGFLLSLLTQVFSLPLYIMFGVIWLSMFAGGVVLDISQFLYYRRGV